MFLLNASCIYSFMNIKINMMSANQSSNAQHLHLFSLFSFLPKMFLFIRIAKYIILRFNFLVHLDKSLSSVKIKETKEQYKNIRSSKLHPFLLNVDFYFLFIFVYILYLYMQFYLKKLLTVFRLHFHFVD